MTDPERFLSLFVGVLLLIVFFLGLYLASKIGRNWDRFRHYWQVVIDQNCTEDDRRLWRFVLRFVYVWLMLIVGLRF